MRMGIARTPAVAMSHDTANDRGESTTDQHNDVAPDGGTEAVVRGREDGSATWVLNSLVMDRVTADETDGAFSITEHHAHPSYQTPYHRHRGEDEIIYVIAGEFTAVTEDGARTAGPGDTVIFPRGHPHALRVSSDAPARALVVCAPAGFESFFHEAGEPADSRTVPEPAEPDIETVEALAPTYDLELLGPPPA